MTSWSIPEEFVPRLRRDLKLQPMHAPPFVAVLRDQTFGTRYKLEPTTARVARAINGRRNMCRLLEHVNRTGDGRLEAEDVCRVVAMLAAAALLESALTLGGGEPGEGEPAVTWMASAHGEAQTPGPVRLRFLDGARFACQGSGMCCAGYDFVPVDDAVLEAVRRHRFSPAVRRRLGRDPFQQVTLDDGRAVRVIRQEGSRCIFLDDNLQCAIHKEIGIEAKPAVCRVFPLTFALGPDGDCFASFSMECGGFAAGRLCGSPLAERADEIAALLPRLPGLHRVPDPLPLAPGREVPWASYSRLESAWLDGLQARELSPAQRLAVLCRQMAAFEAGEEPFAPPQPAGAPLWPACAEERIRPLLERVLRHCTIAARRRFSARDVLAAELLVRVRIAAGLLLGMSDVVGEDLWPSARVHFRRPPGTTVAPSADALFDDQLRNAIFGKQLLQAPNLNDGLGLLVLRLCLSSALAAVVAAHTGAAAVHAAHVNEGIRIVHRCLRASDLRWLDPSRKEMAALVDAYAEACR
jgi:Fe-S-cluster containining protein